MVRKVLAAIAALAITGVVVLVPAAPASADTITVTTNADDGAGSFRQAVADAVAGDTIAFAEGLEPIALVTAVEIDKDLTITGNGAGTTVLSGGDDSVLLIYDDGETSVTITDLSIVDATNDGIRIDDLSGDPLTVVLERVAITGAGDDGIDVDNDDGDVTLIVRDSTISGNGDEGIDASEEGGLAQTEVIVERSTFADNDGDGLQGDGESTTLAVLASTFVGNGGDGIDFDEGASGSVVNSTFSDNDESGIDGSGGGSVTVLNSTVVGNGDLGIDAADGSVTITNTIIDANEPADCAGAVTSEGGNIDGDDSCGLTADGDQPETDPLLGALAANGGPTDTHLPLEGSPAIDAALAAPCPDDDQRGESRPQDGNDDGTAACDVGAVEVAAAQPEPGPTTTTTTTAPPEIPVAPTPPGATPVATPATAQPTFTG